MCVCECECEMRGCVGASEIDGESEETKRNSAFRLDSSPRTRLKMETMNLCTRSICSNFRRARMPHSSSVWEKARTSL